VTVLFCVECGGVARLLAPSSVLYPGPVRCPSCRDLREKTNEVTHEKMIRCPKCRNIWAPDFEDDVWEEDGGEVVCGECGHDFHVTTWITYTFTSPAMEPAEPSGE